MGQQHKKVVKRRRRMAYAERQKIKNAARSKNKARTRPAKKPESEVAQAEA